MARRRARQSMKNKEQAMTTTSNQPFPGISLELEALAEAYDDGSNDEQMVKVLTEGILDRVRTHNAIDDMSMQVTEVIGVLEWIVRISNLGIEALRPMEFDTPGYDDDEAQPE
jgi:hypothetical protein